MTTLVAPIAGPILGGWLCDNYSWPVIFLINVPLALMMGPFAWRMLKRFETRLEKSPIDLIGLALLVVFVGALQLMLDLGKEHDWFESGLIVGLAVVAVIGFAAFLIWELFEKHPIVNLRVFRHRGYTTAVIVVAAGFGAMFAANVLTPLWLQSYMGYTSTWAGLATAWTGVLAVFCAPAAGLLSTKVDPRKLVFFGLMWLCGILAIRSIGTTDMSFWQISIPLLFMGIGLPFFFVPVTTIALASVEEHETASAAGLMNFLRTLAGAVATSIVNTAWENGAQVKHAELAGLVDGSGETMRALAASGFNHEQSLQAHGSNGAEPGRDAVDQRAHAVLVAGVPSCRLSHLAGTAPNEDDRAGSRALVPKRVLPGRSLRITECTVVSTAAVYGFQSSSSVIGVGSDSAILTRNRPSAVTSY